MKEEIFYTRTGVPYGIVRQGIPKVTENKVPLSSTLSLKVLRKRKIKKRLKKR